MGPGSRVWGANMGLGSRTWYGEQIWGQGAEHMGWGKNMGSGSRIWGSGTKYGVREQNIGVWEQICEGAEHGVREQASGAQGAGGELGARRQGPCLAHPQCKVSQY